MRVIVIEQTFITERSGVHMLPPEKHERALQLFCRILHRLEERDRRNEKDHSSPGEASRKNDLILEAGIADELRLSGVSARLNPRAEE